MELSDPDESGRRKPVPTGEFFIEDCDTVVMSLGCSVNPIIPATDAAIKTNKWGVITVDELTCETSKKGVYAGGDVITGGATIIGAMGQAKTAAAAMNQYLNGKSKNNSKAPVDPKANSKDYNPEYLKVTR